MGLGWLGLALAKSLLSQGAAVSGSVTSMEKQQALREQSFDVDIFNLFAPKKEQCIETDQDPEAQVPAIRLASRMKDANLVLNIPPGRQQFNQEKFVSSMLKLIDFAMTQGVHKLVFISTTSVFGEYTGVVDQATPLQATTESGKAHQAIEAHLAKYYLHQSKILRPAGLVGPNSEEAGSEVRHPIYTLCHKVDIPNGFDPVNLIHKTDVIAAIEALLCKEMSAHSFNLSAIEHPSRQGYYQWAAKRLSLPVPSFLPDTKKRQLGKLIDARSSFTELGIEPRYASPFDML
jgi:nucleoside-diphosphate-sugar epimerase